MTSEVTSFSLYTLRCFSTAPDWDAQRRLYGHGNTEGTALDCVAEQSFGQAGTS